MLHLSQWYTRCLIPMEKKQGLTVYICWYTSAFLSVFCQKCFPLKCFCRYKELDFARTKVHTEWGMSKTSTAECKGGGDNILRHRATLDACNHSMTLWHLKVLNDARWYLFSFMQELKGMYAGTVSASGGAWSNWVCLLFHVLWSICVEVIKVTHLWVLFTY